jgi:bleomycin hydrolase
MLHIKKAIILIPIFFVAVSMSQDKRADKGTFEEWSSEFWDKVEEEIEAFKESKDEPEIYFKVDLSGWDLPDDPTEFIQYWHNKPVNQGQTGTCWCFSSSSYFESEIYRLTSRIMNISRMHTVYWETVEKARRFVQERGDSEFSQGSLFNATIRIFRTYGAVPSETYTGMEPGQKHYDHDQLWDEMSNYLDHIVEVNNWNEDEVLTTIKSILNHYLGVPPETMVVNGTKMTPKEYFNRVVKLALDDYVNIISLMEVPFWEMGEYDVPDNWWNSSEYYNVPLDVFMDAINSAIESGYTVGIGGDVSEAGIHPHYDVAIIPSFDIPGDYISNEARQFRFSNKSTKDDHAMHMVGYADRENGRWYLIKDSGSGAHTGKITGYYFFHEDYMKLKIMNIIVHKDAVIELLKRFDT